jgi:DNA polymerase-1
MFIISDYSGIELVILAAVSDDGNLIDQILQGDIHSYVANSLFGPQMDQVLGGRITKDNRKDKSQPFATVRDLFKPVSYGVVYGSTGWNLYRTLAAPLGSLGFHITQDECDAWVDRWKHELFPNTGKLLSDNARYAVTRGYTESVLGRRRRWDLNEIRKLDWMYNAAMREGMNQPIQSSSADMTKLAMIYVHGALDPARGRIALTVHDEIVAEVREDYADEAVVIIQREMERAGYDLFPNLPRGAVTAEPKKSTKYDK